MARSISRRLLAGIGRILAGSPFPGEVTPPPTTSEINKFWQLVAHEEAQGRSLRDYVIGWTNRLRPAPEHQTTRWIRLVGMVEGQLELQEQSVLDIAGALATNPRFQLKDELTGLLEQVNPSLSDKGQRDALRLLAELFRDEHPEKAADCWRQLLEMIGDEWIKKPSLRNEANTAHTELLRLYSRTDALLDTSQEEEHLLQAARTSITFTQARPYYQRLFIEGKPFDMAIETRWLRLHRGIWLKPIREEWTSGKWSS